MWEAFCYFGLADGQVDTVKFVSDFVYKNRNAATRIWYRLSQMATRIKEDIKNSVAKFAYGNAYDEKYGAIREHQEMLRKIEDMRDMFGRALMEAKKTGAKGERAFGLNGKSQETTNSLITLNMTDTERANAIRKGKLQVKTFISDGKELSSAEVLKLKNTYKSKASEILKTLGEKFGVFNAGHTNADYVNKNIDLVFEYSKGSLSESVHKQNERMIRYDTKSKNVDFYDFAKMLYVFRDLVENAQPIETHTDKYVGTKRENPNLEQTYILLSAFKDGDYIIPVEFCIKKYRDNTPNGLYVSVMLKK